MKPEAKRDESKQGRNLVQAMKHYRLEKIKGCLEQSPPTDPQLKHKRKNDANCAASSILPQGNSAISSISPLAIDFTH